MPVYFIVDMTVTNMEGYKEYVSKAPAMIQKVGGRYLVRGGASETMEGDWDPKRLVIVEYPTREAFDSFYHSEEYQSILPVRLKNTEGSAVLVEGAPPIF